MPGFPILLLLCAAWAAAQTGLPRDSAGWTIFAPSPDSRIAYVSRTEGNDATARTYAPDAPEVGADPFLPAGQPQPYRTLAAAFDAVRDGFPDWILLKRGDVWLEGAKTRNGRSAEEPSLFSAYGADSARPLLKTGPGDGVDICCKNAGYRAVAGIEFYAHTRDKDSPDFVSHKGGNGFSVYAGAGYAVTGLLFEDCAFRWYGNNTVQADAAGKVGDVAVRRCVITDDYDTSAHSQGIYANHAESILLEENVLDHNGWYKQAPTGSDNDPGEGKATIFNHNTYFANTRGAVFRGNIFLRSSSIGAKWTANEGEASTRNVVIENNLFVEGEIGISMGGNEYGPYRFKDIRISGNVMLDIGRARPTSRSLGWGLEIREWDGGLVEDNYFLHNASDTVTNAYAIHFNGAAGTRGVIAKGNTVYGLRTGSALILFQDTLSGCAFRNNRVHAAGDKGLLASAGSNSLGGVSFSGNAWTGSGTGSNRFRTPAGTVGLDAWRAFAGETDDTPLPIDYPDPDRTVESYLAHLGKPGTLDAFIEAVRGQSKRNWRPEYTAAAVNDWIRAGFGATSALRPPGPRRNGTVSPSRKGREAIEVFTLGGRRIGVFGGEAEAIRKLPSGVYPARPAGEGTAHRFRLAVP